MKERDSARAELDTLRLVTLEVMRERDQARTLAQDCLDMLHQILRTDGRLHQERREEMERLRDRLRPPGWMAEKPALNEGWTREECCPECGLRLRPGQPCLICSASPPDR